MKQKDLLKALAIVNLFETGKPFGEFAAVAVLNDGAGISYGISQFTHRSGSLAAVVERYLELGGTVGRYILENALPNLRRKEPVVVRAYSKDERLKKALRAAAVTREMRAAQLQIAFENYLNPAAAECRRFGFVLPLSLAVIFDSITHGSYEKIRDRVRVTASAVPETGTPNGVTLTFEKAWITEYVRMRDRWLASISRLNATRYRTRFFLNQIILGSWVLKLPMNVNGFWLRDAHIENLLKFADEMIRTEPAAGPNLQPPKQINNSVEPQSSSQILTPTPQAQPPVRSTRFSVPSENRAAEAQTPSFAHEVGERIAHAAQAFDRVDSIVAGIAYRTDRVKSLWTTVIGTIWQAAWAVFGFIIGLPRAVWLAVAVIAAALTLVYLYRQVSLGKLRERQNTL